jgi:hypothetical protein
VQNLCDAGGSYTQARAGAREGSHLGTPYVHRGRLSGSIAAHLDEYRGTAGQAPDCQVLGRGRVGFGSLYPNRMISGLVEGTFAGASASSVRSTTVTPGGATGLVIMQPGSIFG